MDSDAGKTVSPPSSGVVLWVGAGGWEGGWEGGWAQARGQARGQAQERAAWGRGDGHAAAAACASMHGPAARAELRMLLRRVHMHVHMHAGPHSQVHEHRDHALPPLRLCRVNRIVEEVVVCLVLLAVLVVQDLHGLLVLCAGRMRQGGRPEQA